MTPFLDYCRSVILTLVGVAVLAAIAAAVSRARAQEAERPVPEVQLVCVPGTKSCGVFIPCPMLKRAATPDFMTRADKEGAALRDGSALGTIHARFKEIAAACAAR